MTHTLLTAWQTRVHGYLCIAVTNITTRGRSEWHYGGDLACASTAVPSLPFTAGEGAVGRGSIKWR